MLTKLLQTYIIIVHIILPGWFIYKSMAEKTVLNADALDILKNIGQQLCTDTLTANQTLVADQCQYWISTKFMKAFKTCLAIVKQTNKITKPFPCYFIPDRKDAFGTCMTKSKGLGKYVGIDGDSITAETYNSYSICMKKLL
ncbi:uncharacterized protein LOC128956788 [Oppia nitens]|uniref:uncharacterized protein LOC128956788 n=1 Tax=Oppia nitens TaxID=1686743 RepID=UPI0023DB300E|nr:uncharacterized protein LOC128956788 [Oppia nitens]